ncbi:MAG: oligosaccharide flippase family protein [Chthoniobacterales bacterium]|nr:oligosaccharide flippase family protein [Chthoniobacterales bacterium]
MWIFLSTILSFLANSLDRFLLGKLLTMAELGIYRISVNFARLAFEIATRLANIVIFPILSRYQTRPKPLFKNVTVQANLCFLAGGVTCSPFAIFAPIFFSRFYDPRYVSASEISRWVAINIWAQILLCSVEHAPLAVGHSKSLFVMNLLVTASYGLATPAYSLLGIKGFLLCLSFSYLMAHTVAIVWLPVSRYLLLHQSGIYTLFLVPTLF